jgi:hypothetical protein
MKPRPKFEKSPRHVRLYHWMTETPAWKSLSAVARATYCEIAKRYVGTNNGTIPFSVRELGTRLHIGKTKAARALSELQDRGFLVTTLKGAFSVKNRRATEWRMTEFNCDVTGELATKDFTRWHPKIQNTVPPRRPTVPVGGPFGPHRGAVAA